MLTSLQLEADRSFNLTGVEYFLFLALRFECQGRTTIKFDSGKAV